jgi:putative addiction module CopG family antidote
MFLSHVRLTPEEQEYVMNSVESGRFANAGELVQAALHALRREERARRRIAMSEGPAGERAGTSSDWADRSFSAALF